MKESDWVGVEIGGLGRAEGWRRDGRTTSALHRVRLQVTLERWRWCSNHAVIQMRILSNFITQPGLRIWGSIRQMAFIGDENSTFWVIRPRFATAPLFNLFNVYIPSTHTHTTLTELRTNGYYSKYVRTYTRMHTSRKRETKSECVT